MKETYQEFRDLFVFKSRGNMGRCFFEPAILVLLFSCPMVEVK
jgi:hypothetical protein